MNIKEKMKDDIAILTLKGDLIGEPETTDLKEKVKSLISDDVLKIVLDLGGIKYVNSSGLGTLISIFTTMKNSGGELKLARIGDNTQNLFVMTKLIKVFDTYETVDRALAGFKSKKK